jgi:hypothetical protein
LRKLDIELRKSRFEKLRNERNQLHI